MSLTKKVYEHIDRLEKENKRLEKYIENLQVVHFTELQTEKAENARLRKALKFYADERNYEFETIVTDCDIEVDSKILADGGEKARKELEGEK